MKFVKSSFYFLLSVILFFIAVLVLLAGFMALDEQFTALVIHTITRIDVPGLFIAGGVILFLLSLIVYSLAGRGGSPPASFTFEAEKGPITISLRAIEDYVTKHVNEQHIASSIKTRVLISRDREHLVVRAGISAWSEQNLRQVGDNVQQEISSCLRDGLGLDNLERVVVSVDKIIASKSSRSASHTKPPGDAPA